MELDAGAKRPGELNAGIGELWVKNWENLVFYIMCPLLTVLTFNTLQQTL